MSQAPALKKVRHSLRLHADSVRAVTARGFFKHCKDDIFLGVTAALVREVAKAHRGLSFDDIAVLMQSNVHEERSLAHAILRLQFAKGDAAAQKKIYDTYMKNRGGIRDWDGVDDSAPYIVGAYLAARDRAVLYKLAVSSHMWDRRIAIVSTWHFIRAGDIADALAISEMLLGDDEDLLHKAVGWMLREVGKKDITALKSFLKTHAPRMPRTALRYAIERFPEGERKKWLAVKKSG